jgi:hypothetical protein
MAVPRARSETEKTDEIHLDDPDRTEAEDIIAPLSPMKSTHRRVSLGMSTFISDADESILSPPSFAESQFATIIRRQRPRDTLKVSNVPTRYPNLTQDFEFAGYDVPVLSDVDGDQ